MLFWQSLFSVGLEERKRFGDCGSGLVSLLMIPKNFVKAMLKIQTRCAVPSLAGEQMQSWQRWSHLGKANPHDVLGHHVGPPGCRNFGQRKAWAGRRSGQLVRQAEAEAFGSEICQGAT